MNDVFGTNGKLDRQNFMMNIVKKAKFLLDSEELRGFWFNLDKNAGDGHDSD